jgi:hypothetical protein
MEPEKIPAQTPDFIVEPLEGELLLYHLDEQKVLYLNQTAYLIWQLIDGKRSVGDILGLLSAAYPESKEQITVDLDDTLKLFLENGCIEYL